MASFFVKGFHDFLSEPDKIAIWQKELHLFEDEKKFFQQRLSFTDEVENAYRRFLEEHSLTEKGYDIVHFRLGDSELLKSQGLTLSMQDFIDPKAFIRLNLDDPEGSFETVRSALESKESRAQSV